MPEEVDGLDRIQKARLAKLERLEQAGVRGYPTIFERTHKAQQVHAEFEKLSGTHVCVAGRLGVFKVLSKNLAFAFLHDDSGQLQLIFHPRDFEDAARLVYEALDPGDFVGACGTVLKSNRGEVSVEVRELRF